MSAWPFAVASLPVGFAVAQGTGIRALGGLVLAMLAVAAARSARAGAGRRAGWLGILLACFVASHVLADPLGAWGAVALVTAVTGVAGLVLLDRPGSVPRALAEGG